MIFHEITETCAHLDMEIARTPIRARRVWYIINVPRSIPPFLEFARFMWPKSPEHQRAYLRARLPLIDADATGVP